MPDGLLGVPARSTGRRPTAAEWDGEVGGAGMPKRIKNEK